nr:dynamin family protein [Propionicimonas sp.]
MGSFSPDLATIAGIARRHHLTDIDRRCRTAQQQAAEGLVTVAVLGRFKAGKTTLLNQLLGEDLLPVQAIPATAVITRLRFGPALRVSVKTGTGAPFGIEPAEIGHWATETGNPSNHRGVEWVDVASPALADLAGLVLVDTPGTGSSWKHNTRASLDWLPNVGAAILAVNATQPLAEDDLELLELLHPHTPRILIALTKIDLLTEHDQRAVLEHVRTQLGRRLPVAPSVLPVSSAARHRPQRERLRRELRELSDSATAAATDLAAYRSVRLATECRTYLELARLAATTHAEAMAQLRGALDAESRRLPSLTRQARAQLEPVNRTITARCQAMVGEALPATAWRVQRDLAGRLPAWRGSLAAETAQFRDWLRHALRDAATPFAAACADELGPLLDQGLEPAERMGEAFLQRLGRLVREATGVGLDLPVPQPVRTPVEPVDVMVSAVFDSHLELLSWALPMALLRPLVHRHFLRMVPAQVERNLARTGYRTAAAARRSLEQSLADHVAALREAELTCRQLLDTQSTDLPAIEADLASLDATVGTAASVIPADAGIR